MEGTIFEGMPAADIRAAVERSLAQIPGVRGVNNHTGSLATEDPAVMRTILGVLKSRAAVLHRQPDDERFGGLRGSEADGDSGRGQAGVPRRGSRR
ncbi:MAG: divergent polysaccharide deacetylase family protein [Candidatus Moduliflexus flocculans]|nr:divergent polysaccharide deacetylase family protein [Candidatus Moduliflexus flocculans]